MGVELILGDALEVVRGLPDESFTACFCDPPYGLKFMGKEWDHGVPSKEVWVEVLRVLAPGAVLMAFGGTRTWHRLAVAIEDAGFEVFDTMMWLYGSGFPKSHSIGKAIDKAAGAEREVVGPRVTGNGHIQNRQAGRNDFGTFAIAQDGIDMGTAPATDAAKTWEGYGTALKPAWEPILLARKPRRATYAQTAMEHGTGALNVDGCRVGAEKITTHGGGGKSGVSLGWSGKDGRKEPTTRVAQNTVHSGRWPANLLFSHSDCERVGVKRVKGEGGRNIVAQKPGMFSGGKGQWTKYHDPDGLETVAAYRCSPDCPVAMLDRQSGVGRSSGVTRQRTTIHAGSHGKTMGTGWDGEITEMGYGDTGGASRFFQTFERFYYASKASRRERDAGLEDIVTFKKELSPEKRQWLYGELERCGVNLTDQESER